MLQAMKQYNNDVCFSFNVKCSWTEKVCAYKMCGMIGLSKDVQKKNVLHGTEMRKTNIEHDNAC